MSRNPLVAVAILNYNTRNYLEKFLPSVYASDYPNLKVVLIDNASTDDSVDFMRQNYPEAEIIQLEKNHGFAGGYTIGLRGVKADYFVLLNSDVEVPRNWIKPVIDIMEADKMIAVAQPKMLSYREGHMFEYAGASGGFIDAFGYPFCRGRIFDSCEKDEGQYNDTREIFWASGAALFIKSPIWEEIGGLDPDFFAHMEEIDLCWRLKNRGYKIVIVPQSYVYHVGGGTLSRENPRKTMLNFRNNLICLFKNMGTGELLWKIPVKLVLDGIAGAMYFFTGKWSSTLAIVRAHFFFYRHLFYWIGKRKQTRASLNPNPTGKYKGSIVFAYFVLRKKSVTHLKWKV